MDQNQGETPTTPAPETEADQTSQTPPETGDADARLAAMAAALKKANAEAAAHRKKLEAIERAEQAKRDADLSELEQVRKRLAETEARAAALERAQLQKQAAEKHKLPAALADRLKGETLEELEADAEGLAKSLPKATAPTPPPVTPANPGANARTGETAAQRRERMAGGFDPFDPVAAAQHGGGLVFSRKGAGRE